MQNVVFTTVCRRIGNGFTLIELLVVITIIVVLLSLLTPALDKALYQSSLAVCASKLDGIVTGLTTGAIAHRREYFSRAASISPHSLAYAGDIRPELQSYLGGGGLNGLFNDGFADDVDLAGSQPDAVVYGSYYMFYGWRYTGALGGGGLLRLGDRWSFNNQAFDVAVLDYDVPNSATSLWNTHPDRDGKLQLITTRAGETDSGGWTYSAYLNQVDGRRGEVDTNAAATDGSVTRYADVQPHAAAIPDEHDERFTAVPHYADGADFPNQRGYVPVR